MTVGMANPFVAPCVSVGVDFVLQQGKEDGRVPSFPNMPNWLPGHDLSAAVFGCQQSIIDN
jgi:hypothetical protein